MSASRSSQLNSLYQTRTVEHAPGELLVLWFMDCAAMGFLNVLVPEKDKGPSGSLGWASLPGLQT